MPTFQYGSLLSGLQNPHERSLPCSFYKNGDLVEEFSGANASKLESTVDRLAVVEVPKVGFRARSSDCVINADW